MRVLPPLTEIVPDPRSCGHCGTAFDRADPNYRKRVYCGRPCYIAAEQAKGPVRFWAKVDKGPHPKGCWLYMGFRKWDGYGWVGRARGDARRYMTAHRYAWILTNGEPEKGMHILHECDNPPCCNPAHLRLGTHNENMADMAKRGRNNSSYIKKYRPVLHPDRVRPKRAAS